MIVQIHINANKGGWAYSELFDWPFPLPSQQDDSFCITEIQQLTKLSFKGNNPDEVKEIMEETDWCFYRYRNFRVSADGTPFVELNFEQEE